MGKMGSTWRNGAGGLLCEMVIRFVNLRNVEAAGEAFAELGKKRRWHSLAQSIKLAANGCTVCALTKTASFDFCVSSRNFKKQGMLRDGEGIFSLHSRK